MATKTRKTQQKQQQQFVYFKSQFHVKYEIDLTNCDICDKGFTPLKPPSSSSSGFYF